MEFILLSHSEIELSLSFSFQAVCEWGRDSIESWGRKKRSLNNVTEEEKEEDMTLSQEILVLDLGDQKQSEFLKSELNSADFGRGKPEDRTIKLPN